ncbi:hypothetical protein A6R68_14808, partial [Neotoma lepida]
MWISIPFFISHVTALLGNSLLIFIILTRPSLHGPMYFFLCMLAGADIVLSTSAVPQALAIFWFHAGEISLDRCITQLFFIHSTFISESGILLAPMSVSSSLSMGLGSLLYHIAPHVHVLLGKVCILAPLMLNPVIYGVKTKQIWDQAV